MTYSKLTNEDFVWFNQDSYDYLKAGYLRPGVTLAERVEEIAHTAFRKYRPNEDRYHKFIEYMTKGYISLSSPIWANYGVLRGLPISCNASTVPDTMEGILGTVSEVGMMTKNGSGTAVYLGNLRGRGSKISTGGESEGAVHFARMFDMVSDVCKQSSVRRGATAAYLDIDHPDIEEFLEIRHEGSPLQNLFTGVCVTNGWLEEMENGDVDKRKVWAKLLQSRQRVGMPYIFFTTNANMNKPQVYKDLHKSLKMSQLCSEVILYTDEEESFACCLSSLNALHFDEWRHTDVVEVLTEFLDTVLLEYKEKIVSVPFMDKVLRGVENGNDIGIGVLGYHSYLQSHMIPFESMEAKRFNAELFTTIDTKSLEESKRLASLYGEPNYLKDRGERFVCRTAVAPTSSSSFILGKVSQGIEPLRSNYYIRDMAKKKIDFKNPQLEALLESKGKNTDEVWDTIVNNFGSVQTLDFLTDKEKEVFKTFSEISQMEVLVQAAQRQQWIDQSQSLNLMIHPDTPVKEVNALMMYAYKHGIKTLYYQHSINAAQKYLNNVTSCASCES